MIKLSNVEATKLVEPITEAEIRETIAKLKNKMMDLVGNTIIFL